jgi:hypothetical protein
MCICQYRLLWGLYTSRISVQYPSFACCKVVNVLAIAFNYATPLIKAFLPHCGSSLIDSTLHAMWRLCHVLTFVQQAIYYYSALRWCYPARAWAVSGSISASVCCLGAHKPERAPTFRSMCGRTSCHHIRHHLCCSRGIIRTLRWVARVPKQARVSVHIHHPLNTAFDPCNCNNNTAVENSGAKRLRFH